MNEIIKVDHLYYCYPDEQLSEKTQYVLQDIQLKIKKGEFLAIVGHNGCGKSTLAKHFNAVLIPSKGRVVVNGMESGDENNTYLIRKKVGMVFQNPDNQIVASVVEEDVAFAPENLGVSSSEIRERVDAALKAVRMSKYAKSLTYNLSGGQKQRVAIAGVLAMHPLVLVLDEPTAMLDPIGRNDVMKTIKRLQKDEGITVVIVTHHMEEAALADRVVVMNQGEIVMNDVPRVVFSQVEQLRAIGLDVPQTTELIYELNKSNFGIKSGIVSANECAAAIFDCYIKNKSEHMSIIDKDNYN